MAETRLAIAAECFNRVVEGPDLIAALVAETELGKGKVGPKGHSLLVETMAEAGRNPAVAKILQVRRCGLFSQMFCARVRPGGSSMRAWTEELRQAFFLASSPGRRPSRSMIPSSTRKRAQVFCSF